MSNVKIKESVDEAVSAKGWNMSKKFITILGIEVKNLVKYHRQQNEEDFLEVANYMELQLKYMKKNLNESIKEADLGLTYKKGKTVKVTHKKSGKELVIIDKPNVKREYEKIGYYAESVDEAKKRDYKAEYQARKSTYYDKYQSSTKAQKYRAELNKYNRQKGTYGNGDKKDASHKMKSIDLKKVLIAFIHMQKDIQQKRLAQKL